jgi:hypothetical protein
MKSSTSNSSPAPLDACPEDVRLGHDLSSATSGIVSDPFLSNPPFDLASRPRSELVNPSMAARALGVAKDTLSVWRSTKRYPLRYVRIGRRIFYKVEDILSFIESRAV